MITTIHVLTSAMCHHILFSLSNNVYQILPSIYKNSQCTKRNTSQFNSENNKVLRPNLKFTEDLGFLSKSITWIGRSGRVAIELITHPVCPIVCFPIWHQFSSTCFKAEKTANKCHSHGCNSRVCFVFCSLSLVFYLPAGGRDATQPWHTSFLFSPNYLPCINTWPSSPFFAR